MIRRPPRSTPLYSSAASDVYKRQTNRLLGHHHKLGTDGNGDLLTHRPLPHKLSNNTCSRLHRTQPFQAFSHGGTPHILHSHELGGKTIPGAIEHLLRSITLDYAAVPDQGHPVGEGEGLGVIMSDENHRRVYALQQAHHLLSKATTNVRVQVAGRLIKK